MILYLAVINIVYISRTDIIYIPATYIVYTPSVDIVYIQNTDIVFMLRIYILLIFYCIQQIVIIRITDIGKCILSQVLILYIPDTN